MAGWILLNVVLLCSCILKHFIACFVGGKSIFCPVTRHPILEVHNIFYHLGNFVVIISYSPYATGNTATRDLLETCLT